MPHYQTFGQKEKKLICLQLSKDDSLAREMDLQTKTVLPKHLNFAPYKLARYRRKPMCTSLSSLSHQHTWTWNAH